jgi:hypothetical protein
MSTIGAKAAALGLSLMMLVLATVEAPAERRPGRAPHPQDGRARDGYVWVTAESRWGNGRVSGPVRQGPRGTLEVRTPGGAWLHCERVCSETLRRETIDFWESHGRDAKDAGPGYFHFEWRW